jgi:hypothetical protein
MWAARFGRIQERARAHFARAWMWACVPRSHAELGVLVDDTAVRHLGWTSVANESDERPRPTQLLTDSLSIDSPALA